MEERDLQILRHVGIYWITLRVVLDRLFFAGASSANVLKRLRTENLLQSRKGLAGQLSYYQLTEAGASLLSLPESRARDLAPQSLHVHLGLLWYCCMMEPPRHRLEKAALSQLFGDDPPTGHHCLEAGPKPRVLRAYVPGSDAKAHSVLRHAREFLDAAREKPSVRSWIELRQYGLAILVETESRRQAIERQVRRGSGGGEEGPPLASLAHVSVEAVPSFRTILETIHERE